MTETEFWSDLEFRLCRELAALPQNELRYLWCDGFIPEAYLLNDPDPCVTGRVWIGNGSQSQEQWAFALFLNGSVGSHSEIKWQDLLPPEDATMWLAVDLPGKRIQIEPTAAVPDSRECSDK